MISVLSQQETFACMMSSSLYASERSIFDHFMLIYYGGVVTAAAQALCCKPSSLPLLPSCLSNIIIM